MKKITDDQVRKVGKAAGLSKRLIGYLGDYCRLVCGEVTATPRISKIAAAFEVSERQARRIMNDLKSSGAIGSARRFMIVGGKARQMSNRYTVMLSLVAVALTGPLETAKRNWRASCHVVINQERVDLAKADNFASAIPKTEFTEQEIAEIRSRLARREQERRELGASFEVTQRNSGSNLLLHRGTSIERMPGKVRMV
jgi:hypothetical protein